MSDFDSLSQRVHDVQSRFRAKREQEREQKEQLQSLVEAIERDSEQFNQERAAMREEIAALKQRVTQLEAQNEQLQGMLDGLLEALETGDEEDIGKALQDLEHRVAAIAQHREDDPAQPESEFDELEGHTASGELDEMQQAETGEPAASLSAEDEDPFDWGSEAKPDSAPELDVELELEEAPEGDADNELEAHRSAASDDAVDSLGLQDAQSLIKALARIDSGLEERLGAVSHDDQSDPGYAAKVSEAKRKSDLEGEELAQAAATGVRDILRRVQKRSQDVLSADGPPEHGKESLETDILVLDEADEIEVLDHPEDPEPRRAAS